MKRVAVTVLTAIGIAGSALAGLPAQYRSRLQHNGAERQIRLFMKAEFPSSDPLKECSSFIEQQIAGTDYLIARAVIENDEYGTDVVGFICDYKAGLMYSLTESNYLKFLAGDRSVLPITPGSTP
ncbi:MAG TPA: hypothetical protein VE860_25680 [Chthoniobacterales bacterium]|nr:hypothetical protein [Chthoniobacterales bacterium]